MTVAKQSKGKKSKGKTGRIPKYGEAMRPRTINMPDRMYARLQEEAEIRGTEASDLIRTIIEWYFDAVDRQRGDAEVNTLFDEEVNKKPIHSR